MTLLSDVLRSPSPPDLRLHCIPPAIVQPAAPALTLAIAIACTFAGQKGTFTVRAYMRSAAAAVGVARSVANGVQPNPVDVPTEGALGRLDIGYIIDSFAAPWRKAEAAALAEEEALADQEAAASMEGHANMSYLTHARVS